MIPGAHAGAASTTFVVWSTVAKDVRLRLFALFAPDGRTIVREERLEAKDGGAFERRLSGVGPGALYKFVLDGDELPDPYARFLPFGVHGPARVVAKGSERALDPPIARERLVIYELHVGTFTDEGTFRSAIPRLDDVASLGATAIELLPVAAFGGARGWGYDGVALFAPHAPYGDPEDLRALVRAAHARGLAVFLDVVYNHLGPSGNYLARYAPEYFTDAVKTPWGPAPDFARAPMRRLVLDNVRFWLDEMGFDGLRLDATHAIHDASDEHILHAIAEAAHARSPRRYVFFEDDRNDPEIVTRLGADAVWADDLHHQIHVLLTGERDGYYGAHEPTVAALARCIERGWTYAGEPYPPWGGEPRGRPGTLDPPALVTCIQNHDQVGNRAFGTRLSHEIDLEAYAAASTLLLFLPTTPLLFMGQEWAASTPFLFFTDHDGDLGDAVRRGRREEFKTFAAFADPKARERIPDPQSEATFARAKLRWAERSSPPHARVLELYRALLALRRDDPVLSSVARAGDVEATADGDVLHVVRRGAGAARRLVVSFGDGAAEIDVGDARVLFATRPFDGRTLGRNQAVILSGAGQRQFDASRNRNFARKPKRLP
jgi:maltooligosyltrehalose trehalohydrolase